LLLLGAGNETNLAVPHNVPGKQGLATLAAWAKDRDDIQIKQGDLDPDLKILDAMLDGRAPKELALFLAVHGGADSAGILLIPQLAQDADARDRARSRVRLKDILDRLEKLPQQMKKVLFLDCTQISAYRPLGLFHNDFARQLKELKPRIDAIP